MGFVASFRKSKKKVALSNKDCPKLLQKQQSLRMRLKKKYSCTSVEVEGENLN
jgi:hypothetical protein